LAVQIEVNSARIAGATEERMDRSFSEKSWGWRELWSVK